MAPKARSVLETSSLTLWGVLLHELELLHQHLHVQGVFQVEVVGVLGLEVDVAVGDGRVVQDAVQVHLGRRGCRRALGLTWSRSVRPTSSSTVRTPSLAMYSRSSWAMKVMIVDRRIRACPRKRLRSSGFWVQMPMGQVSRLQTRIMTQPIATSRRGAEAEFLRAQHSS